MPRPFTLPHVQLQTAPPSLKIPHATSQAAKGASRTEGESENAKKVFIHPQPSQAFITRRPSRHHQGSASAPIQLTSTEQATHFIALWPLQPHPLILCLPACRVFRPTLSSPPFRSPQQRRKERGRVKVICASDRAGRQSIEHGQREQASGGA
ncbi:hypothetical protein BCV69DRAFT_282797 [Microstroma glucosiphilum]|uniref:Uncharacterized protein n=1 Tax=Pseudomicrostroma glucosiphilum TaxID=1684307 RepID=A0A316U6Z2_9BASI|nr:hypothetical protein BCV69DRAFT_282797 [Pseudomicrostroma glucosiphilum]PWN20588.1 hypothetical protein BCV69DRAFT_282797 [Pseudomicrostroma glucosiphilum]